MPPKKDAKMQNTEKLEIKSMTGMKDKKNQKHA